MVKSFQLIILYVLLTIPITFSGIDGSFSVVLLIGLFAVLSYKNKIKKRQVLLFSTIFVSLAALFGGGVVNLILGYIGFILFAYFGYYTGEKMQQYS